MSRSPAALSNCFIFLRDPPYRWIRNGLAIGDHSNRRLNPGAPCFGKASRLAYLWGTGGRLLYPNGVHDALAYDYMVVPHGKGRRGSVARGRCRADGSEAFCNFQLRQPVRLGSILVPAPVRPRHYVRIRDDRPSVTGVYMGVIAISCYNRLKFIPQMF